MVARRLPLLLVLLGLVLAACARSTDDWLGDLESGGTFERRMAALALREAPDEHAEQASLALLRALRDVDSEVGKNARASLVALGEKAVDTVVRILPESRTFPLFQGKLRSLLVEIGPPSVEPMRRLAESPDPLLAALALEILEELNAKGGDAGVGD